MTLTLDQPNEMVQGRLGWYNGQIWQAWEVYTSDALTMPATQSLTDASPATIQAADWTPQYARVGTDQEKIFNFTDGYVHKHILIAWNGPGTVTEFELFVPEPASIAMLPVGAGLMLARRRRKLQVI